MLCMEPLNILSPRKIDSILLVFVTRLFIQILRCSFARSVISMSSNFFQGNIKLMYSYSFYSTFNICHF